MAQIIIDVNDSIVADVRDVLCNKWGYPGTGNKMTFLKAYVAAWIKQEYRERKADEAVVTSIDAVKTTSFSTTASADIT